LLDEMRQEGIIVSLNQSLLNGGRRQILSEIICSRRNDMPNSTTGVRDIACIARDYMNMKMLNRLSGYRAGIETNVKTIERLATSNGGDCLADCRPNPGLLDFGQFIPNPDVTARNEEKMAGIDGEGIPDPLSLVTRKNNALGGDRAKRAI